MLEDDVEQLARFAAVLRALDPWLPVRVWRDAHAMIREAGPLLPATAPISLDHDLEREPDGPDPGDGYMVAQWLTSQPVVRPVIIHTSNRSRGEWMAGAFELAGWPHWRVAPLGDEWVESDWRQVVRNLLKRHAEPRPAPDPARPCGPGQVSPVVRSENSMMKKNLIVLAILCMMSGCSVLTPDQAAYTENVYWTNADVLEYPPGETDKWYVIHVTDGTHTVLRLKAGRARSRFTTAHSSHGSFFLLLPNHLNAGETYTCSPTDGTLRYSGFHGYDFSYMHLGRPAAATVRVVSLGKDTIKADVHAFCDVVNGRPRVTDPNDNCHWSEHRRGVVTLRLTDQPF